MVAIVIVVVIVIVVLIVVVVYELVRNTTVTKFALVATLRY